MTVHGSLMRRELLDGLLLSRLVSLLLGRRVELSRSLLLLQRRHDLTNGTHALLTRLSLRVSVLRGATHLSCLHQLSIDILLVLNVRVVRSHSVGTLG